MKGSQELDFEIELVQCNVISKTFRGIERKTDAHNIDKPLKDLICVGLATIISTVYVVPRAPLAMAFLHSIFLKQD